MRWADLLRRVFEIDVLNCGRCGGRLSFVAAIDDPDVVRRILGHLGLPTSIAPTLPARPPPGIAQASFDWAPAMRVALVATAPAHDAAPSGERQGVYSEAVVAECPGDRVVMAVRADQRLPDARRGRQTTIRLRVMIRPWLTS